MKVAVQDNGIIQFIPRGKAIVLGAFLNNIFGNVDCMDLLCLMTDYTDFDDALV